MINTLRIATIANTISPANPINSLTSIKECLNNILEKKPDVVVFSLAALSGNNCGSLYNNDILKLHHTAILDFLSFTKHLNILFVIGNICLIDGSIKNCVTVVLKGEIIQNIPKDSLVKPMLYKNSWLKISPLTDESNLLAIFNEALNDGTQILLLPASLSAQALKYSEYTQTIKILSKQAGIACAMVTCGNGDTSYPFVYGNYSVITSLDNVLIKEKSFTEDILCCCDIDLDIITSTKRKKNMFQLPYEVDFSNGNEDILINITKNPYVSANETKENEFYDDLFNLSSVSLARRLSLTKINKMVIGVSGGLDSTLALLTCAKTADLLGLPHENILAITMPGFGTTKKTKSNAHILMEKLNVNVQEIPIAQSVNIHLNNISHPLSVLDVTYENAQARTRTHILLDIANKHNGLVVGTGDLSEEALGFCTFGGDHLAQFNINACITKTNLKNTINYLAKNEFEFVSSVLYDIINTPISPELLPPDENDNITQKTEQILGPYLLHDFFLYYHVSYNMTPSKILEYAYLAFKDEFDKQYIKEKLSLFLRRFYLNQYKRSCAPDCAVITDVNLCNTNYFIPSDVLPPILL